MRKVGVNCYRLEEEEQEVELHPYREEEAEEAIERLRETREQRDGSAVEAALARVGAVAASDENVMPAIMEAVKAYATVGEVMGALADEFGRFEEPVRF